MTKAYTLKVNDTFEFSFDSKEIEALDALQISVSKYHALHKHRSIKVELLGSNFFEKVYSVKINSNTYKINIFDTLDMLIEEMGLSLGTAQVVNDIKAPMPGLILDVNIKDGDEVKQGDYLLVLEAMKMENTLTAPRDGIVKSVSVQKGQTVEKSQLLIEMET